MKSDDGRPANTTSNSKLDQVLKLAQEELASKKDTKFCLAVPSISIGPVWFVILLSAIIIVGDVLKPAVLRQDTGRPGSPKVITWGNMVHIEEKHVLAALGPVSNMSSADLWFTKIAAYQLTIDEVTDLQATDRLCLVMIRKNARTFPYGACGEKQDVLVHQFDTFVTKAPVAGSLLSTAFLHVILARVNKKTSGDFTATDIKNASIVSKNQGHQLTPCTTQGVIAGGDCTRLQSYYDELQIDRLAPSFYYRLQSGDEVLWVNAALEKQQILNGYTVTALRDDFQMNFQCKGIATTSLKCTVSRQQREDIIMGTNRSRILIIFQLIILMMIATFGDIHANGLSKSISVTLTSAMRFGSATLVVTEMAVYHFWFDMDFVMIALFRIKQWNITYFIVLGTYCISFLFTTWLMGIYIANYISPMNYIRKPYLKLRLLHFVGAVTITIIPWIMVDMSSPQHGVFCAQANENCPYGCCDLSMFPAMVLIRQLIVVVIITLLGYSIDFFAQRKKVGDENDRSLTAFENYCLRHPFSRIYPGVDPMEVDGLKSPVLTNEAISWAGFALISENLLVRKRDIPVIWFMCAVADAFAANMNTSIVVWITKTTEKDKMKIVEVVGSCRLLIATDLRLLRHFLKKRIDPREKIHFI